MTRGDDVLESVEAAVRSRPSARLLGEHELRDVVDDVVRRFVEDPARSVWWWTSLKVPFEVTPYDGHGLALLRRIVPAGHDEVVLLVTDERPAPVAAVRGPLAVVVDVLADSVTFEYAITNPTADWLVFDTHHNQFVVAFASPADPGDVN